MRGSVLAAGALVAGTAGVAGLVGLRGAGSPEEDEVRGTSDGALLCAVGGVPGRQAGMVLVGMRSGGRRGAAGAGFRSGEGVSGDVVSRGMGGDATPGAVGVRPGPAVPGAAPESAAGAACGTGVSIGG